MVQQGNLGKNARAGTQSSRRWAGLASNLFLAAAGIIAVYVLIDTLLLRSSLPAGACPFVLSRPWIVTAVILSAISLILSFFEPKKASGDTDHSKRKPG